jgi:hypothetical protein
LRCSSYKREGRFGSAEKEMTSPVALQLPSPYKAEEHVGSAETA